MEHASNTLPLEHLVGSAELTLRLRKGLRDCRSSHPTNIDIYTSFSDSAFSTSKNGSSSMLYSAVPSYPLPFQWSAD